MPRIKTEKFGTDDFRWMGSARGLYESRTETLDPSLFDKETHYPNGFLPSGLPLTKTAEGVVGPYVSGTTTTPFIGFLTTTQPKPTDDNQLMAVPVLDHGRVLTSFLPVEFTPPTTQNNTDIVFLEA